MLKSVLSELLEKIIEDIRVGNCNIGEEELMEIITCIRNITSPAMSKYKACEYLNISRAKFDNLIREGKLPKGQKKPGFTELFWYKSDLDTANKDL